MRMAHDLTLIMILGGVIFVAFGVLYLWHPTLYRRGIWLRTSIMIRLLSERNYIRYMKGLGIVFIGGGAALLIVAALRQISN